MHFGQGSHHRLRQRVGTKLTVCTDNKCPIHDPREAARQALKPAPTIAPAEDADTEEQAEQRKAEHEQRRKEYQAEREREEEEENRKREEIDEEEREAEQARMEDLRKKRDATFERIIENAPATLSTAQLRVLLRAIVHLDPYTFADDLAADIADENDKRTAEEVLWR